MECESHESLSKFINQVNTISCVENLYTGGMTKEKAEDGGKEIWSANFTCNYTSSQAADDGLTSNGAAGTTAADGTAATTAATATTQAAQ